MDKETANRISTAFIALAILIIAGVAILGLPQLFKKDRMASVVGMNQISAESTPNPALDLETPTPSATSTATPLPTNTPYQPAIYATERAHQATLEALKTTQLFSLTAKQNITLYLDAKEYVGETDYFVVTGQQVELVGTVPNRDWVLVRHPLGELGWASVADLELSADYLALLPITTNGVTDSAESPSLSIESEEVEVALNNSELEPVVTVSVTTTPLVSVTETATIIKVWASPTVTPSPISSEQTPTKTPTAEPTPTATVPPSPTPTPTKLLKQAGSPLPTNTPKAPVIRALNDSAMFAGEDGGTGRIGYFIPEGKIAWVLGRSADGTWLHIVSDLNVEGWVARDRFDLVSGSLDDLPLSDFVTQPRVDVTPDFLLTVTPLPTKRPTATRILQPTATAEPVVTEDPTELLPIEPTEPPVEIIQPTIQPTTLPPTLRPTRIQPNSPTTPTPLPAPATPRPTAGLAPNEAVSVAIAFWKIDSSTTASSGNGTWRTSLVVRVPTSFSYQFSADYLTGSTLSSRNRDGDDIYLLTLAGIPCGQAIQTELIARQNSARMTSRNDATFADTPIFLSYNCP